MLEFSIVYWVSILPYLPYNIFEENAYLFPITRVRQVSILSPSNLNSSASNANHLSNLNRERKQVILKICHYSTMVGENFEYCTSQMPRNASGGGFCCIFKFQICSPQAEFTNLIS